MSDSIKLSPAELARYSRHIAIPEFNLAAQLRLNQMAFGNLNNGLNTAVQGKWYFYNNQSLSFGKTEFQKITD